MRDIAHARKLAAHHLAEPLPRRWNHVQGVGAWAEQVAAAIGDQEDVLATAGWLHDIGYAPDIADTGFHPLDGARFLRRAGIDERVVCLVAHHTCAQLEAEERGLGDVLAVEFPRERSEIADALLYCDMTTSPDGFPVAVPDRLTEIRSRYGPGAIVTRFINRAAPEILATARRTEERMAKSYALV
ncbi:MAG: HD domain-containing protein [Streptosporangiales bacterium]|nr:HD domain-containing protein [Streptosporangiales bacterium]